MKVESGRFAINDTELYVEQRGAGPALILIPGWAYTTEVFRHNAEAFGGSHRVISYDPRGHGRSRSTDEGHGYLQHGRDLHALITALELPEVVLAGWSLGVYDALAYLREFGFGKVRAFISIDESPRIIRESESDWGEGSAAEVAGLIEMVSGEGYLPFFRQYMAEGFVEPPPQALLDQFAGYAAALKPEQAAALLRDAATHDFREFSVEVASKLPFLQVLREEWSEPAVNWIRKHQPEAEICVLGNHLMLMEYAGELNRRILDFLQSRCSAKEALIKSELPAAHGSAAEFDGASH